MRQRKTNADEINVWPKDANALICEPSTDIYSVLSVIDFICVGCSQLRWLSLDSRCGI